MDEFDGLDDEAVLERVASEMNLGLSETSVNSRTGECGSTSTTSESQFTTVSAETSASSTSVGQSRSMAGNPSFESVADSESNLEAFWQSLHVTQPQSASMNHEDSLFDKAYDMYESGHNVFL